MDPNSLELGENDNAIIYKVPADKNWFKREGKKIRPRAKCVLYVRFSVFSSFIFRVSRPTHTHTHGICRRIIRFFPSSAEPFQQTILSALFRSSFDALSHFIFFGRCVCVWGSDGMHINKFVKTRFVGGRWHIRSRLCHRQMMMLHELPCSNVPWSMRVFFFISFITSTQFYVSNLAP